MRGERGQSGGERIRSERDKKRERESEKDRESKKARRIEGEIETRRYTERRG